MTTRRLCILAVLTVLLFVQEQLLVFLPNISLTVFLLILYTKVLGFRQTLVIIIIYTLLDSLYMASLSLSFYPFMVLGWSFIPLLFSTVFKKCENSLLLALGAILVSFLYSWTYVLPNWLFLAIDLKAYLIADLPFELLLASSSFLTTLWLYSPLKKRLTTLYETP